MVFMFFKKERKSKAVSIRAAPSLLEKLDKNKINKSKLFTEAAEKELKKRKNDKKRKIL